MGANEQVFHDRLRQNRFSRRGLAVVAVVVACVGAALCRAADDDGPAVKLERRDVAALSSLASRVRRAQPVASAPRSVSAGATKGIVLAPDPVPPLVAGNVREAFRQELTSVNYRDIRFTEPTLEAMPETMGARKLVFKITATNSSFGRGEMRLVCRCVIGASPDNVVGEHRCDPDR